MLLGTINRACHVCVCACIQSQVSAYVNKLVDIPPIPHNGIILMSTIGVGKCTHVFDNAYHLSVRHVRYGPGLTN